MFKSLSLLEPQAGGLYFFEWLLAPRVVSRSGLGASLARYDYDME